MRAVVSDVGQDAIRLAVHLMHQPSRARYVRAEPLPQGLLSLLQIAAGDEDAERQAASLLKRTRQDIRRAANFFIEQVMLYPGAESYRILGADPRASAGELRRHMVLLQRWLHVDADRGGEHRIFVGRVTAAWNDVKTPDRRSAYDLARFRAYGGGAAATVRPRRMRRTRHPRRFVAASNRGFKAALRRAVLFVLARL